MDHIEFYHGSAHTQGHRHKAISMPSRLRVLENTKELTIWEKIYIQKNRNRVMNFDIPMEGDLVWRFFGQPQDGADIDIQFIIVTVMNFPPFGGHFPAMHQFAAAKFSNDQIQTGTMLVTSASDGTIQYIRPEHNGANFLAANANTNPVQGIPVSIATPSVNVPVSMAARGVTSVQQIQQQQHHQQQLAAVMNPAAGNKYHPHGTILSWGEVPLVHHFNEAGKNITTINVPYPNPSMNSASILAVQPTPTSGASTVWPVRIMQNVSTMTVNESELQPKDLCKAVEDAKAKTENENIKRGKESGESEEDSDDSSKSASATSEPEQNQSKQYQPPVSLAHPITNGGGLECHQIQLQQQGSAMADYLARLQPTTIPLSLQHFIKFQSNNAAVAAVAAVSEAKRDSEMAVGTQSSIATDQNDRESLLSSKKKKKKKVTNKPPRPKPGEIRLSTALDGSTLFCCPDCYMAYPDREMLEQHLAGHKQERRFVCNLCGACLKRKEHLDQHKRGHSEERPYVCNVCMKGFKRNEHLTRHYVIHSGNKNHACVECGKAFSRKDHLHKHTQTHIAKRVKAELSQAASLENNSTLSPVPTPPTSMTIPHIIPHHHHQQPIPHPLQFIKSAPDGSLKVDESFMRDEHNMKEGFYIYIYFAFSELMDKKMQLQKPIEMEKISRT
ncbi:hypothetical protein L9F63_004107, partial [Diploptera punctata]